MTAAQQEALIGQQYQQQCAPFPRTRSANVWLTRDALSCALVVLAQCARGLHDPKTVYGVWGIIVAVLLFPIGLIFLLYVCVRTHRVLVADVDARAALTRKRGARDVACASIRHRILWPRTRGRHKHRMCGFAVFRCAGVLVFWTDLCLAPVYIKSLRTR